MDDVLAVDGNPALPEALRAHCGPGGIAVEWARSASEAAMKLGSPSSSYKLVVVNVSNPSVPWLRLLHAFQEAASRSQRAIQPLYLCVSAVKKDVLFEFQIEQTGARILHTDSTFSSVHEKVDLSLLEYRSLESSGPRFTIVHEWHAVGTECMSGETVAAVFLTRHGRDFYIPLSVSLRLLFDCLAKHRRLPLNSSEIAACFQVDEFYKQHGSNIGTSGTLKRRVTRTSVRVYVERLRHALALVFREANLRLDPRRVLASEEAGYRLRASVRVLHVDGPEHGR